MTELTSQLLKLINEEKTINEISETMNISHKRIYNILTMISNKGFEFERKYYYNGDIVYVPKTSFIVSEYSGVDLITSPIDNNLEALVISDLHIGSDKERIDLLNKAYDYCTKEGIHIIIICGDIIEGMFGTNIKIHDNIHDQIDYVIKNYPFDKNILNFAVLGDHDYDSMKRYGQNLAKVFDSYRHDIISLGYGIGQINIKNDKIIVNHPAPTFDERKIPPMNKYLILSGHSHRMKLQNNINPPNIHIPPLSEVTCQNEIRYPSAVKINLEFKNGLIAKGNFTQLLFDNRVFPIGEYECLLGYGKDFSNKPIKLEEDRTKKKILIPEKREHPMSQIEKFNTRYNIK